MRQMKRQNFLFEKIIDYSNIRLAFLKALRGNRLSPAASHYKGSINDEKAGERIRSVFAAIGLARTNRFRKSICEKGEQLQKAQPQTKCLMATTA